MKKQLSIALASVLAAGAAMPAFADSTTPELSVLYNAKTLESVKPVIENDRTMLPFRALLETIGATVDYDEATRKVSAKKGDIAITFPLDDQTIYITKTGGETSEIKSDVANIIIDDRVYVPLRFMANAFELNVGWDAKERAAIVVDTKQYFDDLSHDAKTFFEYMELCAAYPEKYHTSSTFQFTFNLTGAGMNDVKFSADTSFDTDIQADKAAMDAKLTLDGNLISTLTGVSAFDSLKGVTVTGLYQDGTVYLKTNLVDLLNAQNPNNEKIAAAAKLVNADTWCKADLKALLTQLGLPAEMADVLKSSVKNTDTAQTFEDALDTAFSQEITTVADAQMIQNVFNTYKVMLSDENVTLTKKADNSCELEMKLGKDAMKELMIASAGDMSEEEKKSLDSMVFDLNVKTTVKDGIAAASSAKMNMSLEAAGTKMDMTMDASSVFAEGSDKTIELPNAAIDLLNVIKLFQTK